MSNKETTLNGIALSGGIAIGKGHLLKDPCFDEVPEFSIPDSQAEFEVERYREAISSSKASCKTCSI